VLGFWLHHSLSQLPGTAESSGILPGYLTSFSLASVAVAFLGACLLLLVLGAIAGRPRSRSRH